MVADVDVVVPLQEVDIVGQGIVPSAEGGLREGGDVKEARHLKLVDLVDRRLVNTGDAKVGHVHTACGRSTNVILDLIADDQVVDHVTAEGVRLRDQRVVIVVRDCVVQAEDILEILHALQDKCVGEVPLGQFVFRTQFLVCTCRDLRLNKIVWQLKRSNGASRRQRRNIVEKFCRYQIG